MENEINIGGEIYISSRGASKKTGFAQDYIGQLIRSGKVEGTKMGRTWYVKEGSLFSYIQNGKDHKEGEYGHNKQKGVVSTELIGSKGPHPILAQVDNREDEYSQELKEKKRLGLPKTLALAFMLLLFVLGASAFVTDPKIITKSFSKVAVSFESLSETFDVSSDLALLSESSETIKENYFKFGENILATVSNYGQFVSGKTSETFAKVSDLRNISETFKNGYLSLGESILNKTSGYVSSVSNQASKLTLEVSDYKPDLLEKTDFGKFDLQLATVKHKEDSIVAIGEKIIYGFENLKNDIKVVILPWVEIQKETQLASLSSQTPWYKKVALGFKELFVEVKLAISSLFDDVKLASKDEKLKDSQEIKSDSINPLDQVEDKKKSVVVVPAEKDRDAQIAKIKSSFSDTVEVLPDKDGETGVIRPVFRDRVGGEYLYVMIPVDGDK